MHPSLSSSHVSIHGLLHRSILNWNSVFRAQHGLNQGILVSICFKHLQYTWFALIELPKEAQQSTYLASPPIAHILPKIAKKNNLQKDHTMCSVQLINTPSFHSLYAHQNAENERHKLYKTQQHKSTLNFPLSCKTNSNGFVSLQSPFYPSILSL